MADPCKRAGVSARSCASIMLLLAGLGSASGTPSLPAPPLADRVIEVAAAHQGALEEALAEACQAGRGVVRVVLPEGALIPIEKQLAAVMVPGEGCLVVDFNGAVLDFRVETDWRFIGGFSHTMPVRELESQGGNAVLHLEEEPAGLGPGDWVRLVSEDRAPAHRSDTRRMGQAMRVRSLEGRQVVLEGQLYRQELYQTGIRLARYLGNPRNLWLVEPRMTGSLEHFIRFIALESLVQPRVLRPEMRHARGFFIEVAACVDAIITDPSLHEGINVRWPEYTYGIYSFASLRTTVLAGADSGPHVSGLRHAVDAGANTPKTPEDLIRYGPDIGMRTFGLHCRGMLAAAVGCHPGAWATVAEGVRVQGGDITCTLRGLDHVYRDFQSHSKRGIQLHNGRGFAAPSPVRVELSPDNVLIEDSRIYATEGPVLFTSSYRWERDGIRQPVGRIRICNSLAIHSGKGAVFDIGHAASLEGENLRILLKGQSDSVFRASQTARILIRGLTLDLTEFTGKSVILVESEAGSLVHLDGFRIINPGQVPVFPHVGEGLISGLPLVQ